MFLVCFSLEKSSDSWSHILGVPEVDQVRPQKKKLVIRLVSTKGHDRDKVVWIPSSAERGVVDEDAKFFRSIQNFERLDEKVLGPETVLGRQNMREDFSTWVQVLHQAVDVQAVGGRPDVDFEVLGKFGEDLEDVGA